MGRIKNAWDVLRGHQVASKLSGEIALADPFRLIGQTQFTQYNPSELVSAKGYRVIDKMRRDEQVKAAMLFKKHAAIAAGWEIVAPEETDSDEVVDFVQDQLNHLDGTLEQTILEIMTALDFGFSVSEKVFEEREGRIGLRAIKTKRPKWFKFAQDAFGNIENIIQVQPGGDIPLPREKFVVFTYQPEFGNPYGVSDLEAAYRAWWSKDHAYKWLNMLLERFGVPPIFALYNSDRYQGSTLDKLKDVLSNMQAATSGMIPRGDGGTEDLELWAPELAGQVASVFGPALDRFDKDIAKAILMPGLLGISPEESTGSMARAKVVFDVFMFVVEHLRDELTETVMNEQIVRPLVDLNFNGADYPEFRLLPINDQARLDLFKTWGELVQADVVISTFEDEKHVRAALEFPERDEDDEPLIEPAPPTGFDKDPNDEDDDEPPADFALARSKNLFERRTNFVQIERALDGAEQRFVVDAQQIMSDARDTLIKRVKAQGINRTTLRKVKGLPNVSRLRTSLNTMMIDMLDAGRDALAAEVPGAREMREDDEKGPNFVPAEAVRHVKDKSMTIAAAVDDEVTREVRRAIEKSLETGETTRETAGRLEEVFRPFIGDATKIKDGKALAPHRLEAIARTESTAAFNQGRLVESRRPGISVLMRGMEYSAVIDSRTTPVCEHLDGRVFRMDDPALDRLRPPRHVNCRSVLVPVTVAETVEESDFVTPGHAARGLELSAKGFK